METKESMFILAIVGIVAIVGVIVLVSGTRTNSISTTSYEDNVGQATRAINVVIDPAPQITNLYMYPYGYKNYNLQNMQYQYDFSVYGNMATDISARSQLSAYCTNYNTGLYFGTSSSGNTKYNQYAQNYYLDTSGGSSELNFEQMNANCYVNGCVSFNNDTNTTCEYQTRNFNSAANSYPNLVSGNIMKNTVTNQYYVYFQGNNYNGGICYLSYSVQVDGTGQYQYWGTDLPNCPANVTYLAPLNLTPTQENTTLYLSIYLRPQTNDIATSGWGMFTFDSAARPASIQKQNLVAFKKVTTTTTIKAMQKTSELVTQEIKKVATGQPVKLAELN